MDFKYSVIFTDAAHEELETILDYLINTLCNLEAGKNLWFKLQEIIEKICILLYAFPVYRGRYINNRIEYRKVNVHNYIVIYKIFEDKKEIIICGCKLGIFIPWENGIVVNSAMPFSRL